MQGRWRKKERTNEREKANEMSTCNDSSVCTEGGAMMRGIYGRALKEKETVGEL